MKNKKNDKRKKLLYFMTTLGKGGSDKMSLELLNRLDRDKYDISLVCIFPGGYYSQFIKKDIKIKTILPFDEKFSKFYNHISRVIIDRLPRKFLYRLFVRGKYDIEMTCEDGFGAKIIGGSSNHKSKKILWEHMDALKDVSIPTYYSKKKAYRYFEPFDRIIAVSNDCKESFIQKYGFKDRVSYIYNPIDIETIEKESNEEIGESYEEGFNILTIGRLMPQKAYLRLIDVVKKLYDKGVNFNLRIIGEGPQENEINESIKQYGIDDRVKLLCFKTNPYPYIKNADLVVCSSIHESYCLVVAESLVLGTPVLSTKCTGPIELLGDGKYGMLVENSDDGLESGIEKMVTDNETLEHYREMAIERKPFFDIDTCIDEFEKIFEG